jgi:hypothetical protein
VSHGWHNAVCWSQSLLAVNGKIPHALHKDANIGSCCSMSGQWMAQIELLRLADVMLS